MSVRIGVALGAAVLSFVVAVSPTRGAEPLRDTIDRLVAAKWAEKKIEPAPPATDAEFLRRVYLDLVGTIPKHDEARAFLDDSAPDKRSRLIDRLLEDPRFAQRQADFWDGVLIGRDPPGFDAQDRDGFQRWLRQNFERNVPYDRWARQLIQADGNTAEQGAPMFLVQYRNQPEDAAVAVSQRLLGVQLQCARCHDHPYESWSQRDFYGFAAFFARLEVVDLGKRGDDKALAIGEKRTGEILFTGPAAEAEAGQKGEAIAAKFLLGEVIDEPPVPEDFEEPRNFPNGKQPPKPDFSRKDRLAAWLTESDNPFFARAVANRVWAQYLGRGLVHPVDNMSESNPPSHPELLDAMAAGLKEHGFDLKWYIRELVHTRTYQLAGTGDVERERPLYFERARTRPLEAEELLAAWVSATWYDQADDKFAERFSKDRYYPLGSGYLLQFFGEPADGTGNFLGGVHEQLFMNNGGIDRLLSLNDGGLIKAIAEGDASWEDRVETLFLSVLSRRPTAAEQEKFVAYLSAEERPHDRVRDAVWALITCSEFRFNH